MFRFVQDPVTHCAGQFIYVLGVEIPTEWVVTAYRPTREGVEMKFAALPVDQDPVVPIVAPTIEAEYGIESFAGIEITAWDDGDQSMFARHGHHDSGRFAGGK